jgi:hypothetical protein
MKCSGGRHRLNLAVWIELSVHRSATDWTVQGSKLGGGEIFRTHPDRTRGAHSLLYNGYRVSFLRVKLLGVAITTYPLYSLSRVLVEQYFYLATVPARHVTGQVVFLSFCLSFCLSFFLCLSFVLSVFLWFVLSFFLSPSLFYLLTHSRCRGFL